MLLFIQDFLFDIIIAHFCSYNVFFCDILIVNSKFTYDIIYEQ